MIEDRVLISLLACCTWSFSLWTTTSTCFQVGIRKM